MGLVPGPKTLTSFSVEKKEIKLINGLSGFILEMLDICDKNNTVMVMVFGSPA